MKKIISLILTLAVVLTFCACGAKKAEYPREDTSVGMANPVHECTAGELLQATGIGLAAPQGAEHITYSYIDASPAISQVSFTLGGNKYCYRAQPTAYTSIEANLDVETSGKELNDALSDCTNIGAALTGIYSDWKNICLYDLENGCESIIAFNEGKEGFISWLDVVPGVLYSVSVRGNVSEDLLLNAADICFIPLQGNSGGDSGDNAPSTQYSGTYTDGDPEAGADTVTLTDKGQGQFDAEISIFRLAQFEGHGSIMDGAMELELTDPNGGTMYGIFYPADSGTFILKITQSSWNLLPAETCFEGFTLC